MSSSISILGRVVVVTKRHGKPTSLGIVQIMIGLINILFGIPLTNADRIGVIALLGGLIYISSGALTVFAEKKRNTCLFKWRNVMNICSAVTAASASLYFFIDLSIFHNPSFFMESSDIRQMKYMYKYQELIHGIVGVLLVFSILQFIISVRLSAFACRAMCDSSTEQVVTIQTPEAPINTVSKGCLPSSTINPHDIIYASSVGPSVLNNYAQLDISSETEPSKLQ